MNEQFETLQKEMKAGFPHTQTQMNEFDSGGWMVDVLWNARHWVFDYQPSSGFGVVEVGEDDAFSIHYDFMSLDFQSAKEKLFDFLHRASEHVLLAA